MGLALIAVALFVGTAVAATVTFFTGTLLLLLLNHARPSFW